MLVDPILDRETLARDGAVVVRALLDDTWCARLHAAIERCRATPGPHYGVLSPPGAARVDSDLFRWPDDPDLYALTHDSPVVDCAAALLGEDEVVLVEDQWFASEPGAATPSPWHQDEPYYRIDRPFLTLWVTLDDVGEGASLRIVARSHATGTLYAPVEFSARSSTIDGYGELAPVPDIEACGSAMQVSTWTLQAGDAVALDSRLLHATGRMVLDRPFRRISTRWAAPGARYHPRPWGTARFWDMLDHGLAPGHLIAGEQFPLVRKSLDVDGMNSRR